MLICGFRATTKQGPPVERAFLRPGICEMRTVKSGQKDKANRQLDGSIATWAESFAYRDGLYDRDGECELVSRCQHGELIGTDNGFYAGSAH